MLLLPMEKNNELTHDFLHALSNSSRSLAHSGGTTSPAFVPRADGGAQAAYASRFSWQSLLANRRTEASVVVDVDVVVVVVVREEEDEEDWLMHSA